MSQRPDTTNSRILIVDDQAVNVGLLEIILQRAGYTEVSSTTNPEEVIDLYRQDRYDLVLLDLLMPRMDGFQVLDELKKFDAHACVVVITGQTAHELRALQVGAKGFISKPFSVTEVADQVRAVLEKYRQTPERRPQQ
jgi:DNA-binding NtrC family response regulator